MSHAALSSPASDNPVSDNSMSANPVLAEAVRSGFTESRHHGAVAALNADGTFAFTAGAAETPVFPRSSNKPMQAVAMVRAGLSIDGELLALAAASHSGEDFHVEGARKILAGAGLTEDALQCPPSLPGDEPESRIRYNCSGKHAAMLATCVVNGWPAGSYLDPEHPLQRLIKETVEELAGERVIATGVDGCGAPLFALTLAGLARSFRALVLAAPGTAERTVADAFRAYPAWTSGTERDERKLMDAVPGLLLKAGAEGVNAFALPDGRAGALKIDDGTARARMPVTVAMLRALGVRDAQAGLDGPGELDQLATVTLTGGGRPVGQVVATGIPAAAVS